jgi:micrococcal nuclease
VDVLEVVAGGLDVVLVRIGGRGAEDLDDLGRVDDDRGLGLGRTTARADQHDRADEHAGEGTAHLSNLSHRFAKLQDVRSVLLGLGLIVVASGCGAGAADSGSPQQPSTASRGTGVVVEVTDGDTVRVNIGGRVESVRLIGIDTPETHGPGGLRECFGAEASKRTAALLPRGTAVTLVRDAEPRDRYGRLLAYLYRADDNVFVNLALARDGFAAPLTIAPNVAHSDRFVAAAADARSGTKGLWGACGGPDTPLRRVTRPPTAPNS